jgi:hypothetical protein
LGQRRVASRHGHRYKFVWLHTAKGCFISSAKSAFFSFFDETLHEMINRLSQHVKNTHIPCTNFRIQRHCPNINIMLPQKSSASLDKQQWAMGNSP